jgi:MFS family permease
MLSQEGYIVQQTGRNYDTLRNFLALTGDFVFFSIGFAFFDPLVVVPVFVKEFTGSEFLVGLLAAIRTFMVTAPQLWAASILARQSRKKPVLIASSVVGRVPVFILAIVTLWWGESHVWWLVAILAVSVAIFFTSEGFNGVSWPVLVGKVLPDTIRGRFFGLGQLLSSLGAAIAGYFVNRILTLQGQTLAARWSIVFALGFVILMLSVVSMAFIKEEGEEKLTAQSGVKDSFRMMLHFLRSDANLRRVVVVQLALYTAGAVSPFFVIRAGEILPGVDAQLGTFIMLQSVGSAVAAVAGGYLVDRVGSWAAIRLGAVVKVMMLGVVTLAGLLSIPLLLYWVAFFMLGYVNGSSWWSFSAYLLDIATEEQRPIYLAASGIMTSILVLNPVIAGACYAVFVPEVVFAGSAVLALVGLTLAWTLQKGNVVRSALPGETAVFDDI